MAITVKLGRASRNVAATATVTSSVEDTDYPAANFVNLDPGKPGKLTGTTGYINFVWAAAQRIDHILVIHHNLTPGLANVTWKQNASAIVGATTVNAALVVPSDWEDGYPVSFHKDLTGVTGYSSGGFQYGRLDFATANAAPIAIGEIVLISQMDTITIVRPNVNLTDDREAIVHETDYQSETIYDRGVPRRTFSADILSINNLTTYDSIWRDLKGRINPFAFIPNTAVNDAWFVRNAEKARSIQYLEGDGSSVDLKLSVKEVSKGLYL